MGVYAVKVLVGDVFYFGMLNIGHNPTFGSNSTRTMEVNIFDFNQNIYQKNIRVYFKARIRDEKKFNSPEELVSQLNMDKDQALKIVK
jgi:riboflavin kinase/FMN adenylyltransferase